MLGFRSSRSGAFRAMRGSVAAWLVGFVAFFGGTVWAQGPNRGGSKFDPDSSGPAETLLRNAASHVRDRQWSEAIKLYQRVIEQFGEKVAKLPKDEPGTDPSGEFILYVDDRTFCHRCLAHLPPEAREIYRNRVDGVAERWFRQGASQRDSVLLRRVVNEAFCSSWGDDALELLGDMAFQDGRFAEALWMYRRLVPDRAENTFVLVHPDPSVDLCEWQRRRFCVAVPRVRTLLAQPTSTHSRGFIRGRPARWRAGPVRMPRSSPKPWDPIIWLNPLSPTAVGRLSRVRHGGPRSSPDRLMSGRNSGVSSSTRFHNPGISALTRRE